jgi:hypothetical protein
MTRSIQVAAPWSRPSDLATMDGLGGGAHAEVGELGHHYAISSVVRKVRPSIFRLLIRSASNTLDPWHVSAEIAWLLRMAKRDRADSHLSA